MDMAYKIVRLSEEQAYVSLVILCNSNSPYDYINDISKKLDNYNRGTVVIDQILHVGNTEKRFIAFNFDGNKLKDGNFVYIKKNSQIRKMTCDFLKENGLTNGSILSSIQVRMIEKGITI